MKCILLMLTPVEVGIPINFLIKYTVSNNVKTGEDKGLYRKILSFFLLPSQMVTISLYRLSKDFSCTGVGTCGSWKYLLVSERLRTQRPYNRNKVQCSHIETFSKITPLLEIVLS